MRELDAAHPGYGLASHKGYATPEHRRTLAALGPCPLHRRSFAPVRAQLPDSPTPTTPLLFDESLLDDMLLDEAELEAASE